MSDRLRRDLTAVVQTALCDRPGIEVGIWQGDSGSLACAFPRYQGSGPKTDVPQAELPRIQGIIQAALSGERQVSSRYETSSQIPIRRAPRRSAGNRAEAAACLASTGRCFLPR